MKPEGKKSIPGLLRTIGINFYITLEVLHYNEILI
jgi:hypothetical protein